MSEVPLYLAQKEARAPGALALEIQLTTRRGCMSQRSKRRWDGLLTSPLSRDYRGTSLIRNTHPPRIIIGP